MGDSKCSTDSSLGNLKKPVLRGYCSRYGLIAIAQATGLALLGLIPFKIWSSRRCQKIKDYNRNHNPEELYEQLTRKGYFQP